jgi:ligand-binding SRPBCC domain-containing protein
LQSELTHNGRHDAIRVGPSRTGHGFRLETVQFLRQPRDRVFEFFSDAFQLETITPPWLHFCVISPAPVRLAAGALIDYRLRLHGITIRWQSRIRVWEPPVRFEDEQTRGPYRRWHHQHFFEPVDDGTLCRDIVDYEVHGGRLIEAIIVRRNLWKIFAFRLTKLQEIFPSGSHVDGAIERSCG